MKVSSKTLVFVVALSSLLVVSAYFGWSKAKASTTKAPDLSVEYVFTSNGVMLGTEPSPLEIVQASRNGVALPLGGAFKSDVDLLSGVTLQVKNASLTEIKFAKLSIDWINPQTNRVFAAMCGLEVSSLAPGAERTGQLTVIKTEKLREGFQRAVELTGSSSLRLLIQVDMAELANGTLWKYGLIHRKDANDPNNWVPVLPASRIGLSKGEAKVQKVSFKPIEKPASPTAFFCAYWTGLASPGHYCQSCECYIYDDKWTDTPNQIGQFDFQSIPQGCNGKGWWECPGCNKLQIQGPC